MAGILGNASYPGSRVGTGTVARDPNAEEDEMVRAGIPQARDLVMALGLGLLVLAASLPAGGIRSLSGSRVEHREEEHVLREGGKIRRWRERDQEEERGSWRERAEEEEEEERRWREREREEELEWRRAEVEERRKEATLALLSARSEMAHMLLEAGRLEEALVELRKLASLEHPGDDPEAGEILSSAFLESVEMLGEEERWADAEKVARLGLEVAPGGSNLRGFLLMSLGNLLQDKGETDRALETMREAAAFFEEARKRSP